MSRDKFHALAYLYLLFAHGKRAKVRDDVKGILKEADVGRLPTPQVVVFDCMNADSSVVFTVQ